VALGLGEEGRLACAASRKSRGSISGSDEPCHREHLSTLTQFGFPSTNGHKLSCPSRRLTRTPSYLMHMKESWK
jgi:hypothetical protein